MASNWKDIEIRKIPFSHVARVFVSLKIIFSLQFLVVVSKEDVNNISSEDSHTLCPWTFQMVKRIMVLILTLHQVVFSGLWRLMESIQK